MAPEEIFSQLGLWMVNACLQPYTFYLLYILFSICESGSTKFLNTNPIGSGSTTLALTITVYRMFKKSLQNWGELQSM